MKVTVTALPKLLSSFFVNVKKIAADEKTMDYVRRMKEFIFGKDTLRCAALMDMDIYNLVFIRNIPFREYISRKVEKIPDSEKENVMTALLINALYKGKPVRLVPLLKKGDNIIMGEAELLRLSIIDTSLDYNSKNRQLLKKSEKNAELDYELSKSGLRYVETIQMGIVKYYMKKAINEKEFMDKVNFRRFSSGLRLNNRPAGIDDINALLNKRKNMTFIDLTEPSARIYLSLLYIITFKKKKLSDVFNSDKVFTVSPEDDYIYSQGASEFINIIYNGNGIEIADTLIKMAECFGKIDIPVLEPGNLIDLIDNFKEINAVAAIAYKFDKAFSEHMDLKVNMRRKMIDNYWTVYFNIIQYKKFATVVAFCYLLASLDLNKYRDEPAYTDEILTEFAEMEKAVKEINKIVNGVQ